ncbi:Gfo/Idh/MocA family oxidoreductase [Paenibacillus oceani]|uniref:Gfo/Idh/MocA family oxidoreductase n=1 Tax=Paenibacillus oceani TaxID=2772510 RepID=A0A927C581_9BACL|nr:Gfo/Idh/MocA family oxidoreductase [Paenibacillus oceani]MBD2861583.1 Gfo/Idh/MocA family oxidoreductase [Paenibacillus oceani]
MTVLKIGLVDLDTSHPGSFVPILRKLGHEVAAVYDGGIINPEGYAAKFAQDQGIATVCESVADMVDRVDIALIHSCDWDIHIERARPFVEAGKAVFLDKPIAGNVRDLNQIVQWVKDGARITGGSSLRSCNEVREWRTQDVPAEEWVYALAGCAVDEFNYGIHAYSMLHGLMGPGVRQVRYIGGSAESQRQYELMWEDGRRGVVSVGKTSGYLPFYANVVTQKRVDYIKVNNGNLYQSLLETVLPYLAGSAPADIAIEQLVEVELAAIAAKLSFEQGGATIALNEIPESYAGYDGAVFAKSYKELKYPSAK